MLPNGKVAVILGHPADLLRIYRFAEIHKPIIYILTDGSGSKGESRLEHVTKIIDALGATVSDLSCRFTDSEMYRVVRDGDTATIRDLVDEIAADIEKNDIEIVAGDALEGFNPIHDLCRYLTNAVVEIHTNRTGRTIGNFDFLLDGPPDEDSNGSISIALSEAEFERKMTCVSEYPGVEDDVRKALLDYGKEAFQTESLRPVKDVSEYVGRNGNVPFYESYGAKMVEKGVYAEVITFEEHLLPIAKYLKTYADASAARA